MEDWDRPGTAAKAIEGLVFGINGEGRGLFVVEGAKTKQVFAAALQTHIAADHRFNITAKAQFFNKTVGQHGGPSFPVFVSNFRQRSRPWE